MPKRLLISKQVSDQKQKLLALQVSQALQEFNPLQFGATLESQTEQIQKEEATLHHLEERQASLEQQLTETLRSLPSTNLLSKEEIVKSMGLDLAMEYIAKRISNKEHEIANITLDLSELMIREMAIEESFYETSLHSQRMGMIRIMILSQKLLITDEELNLQNLQKIQEQLESQADEQDALDSGQAHTGSNDEADSGINESHESNSGHINGKNGINREMTDADATPGKFETDIHFDQESSNAFSYAVDIQSSQNTPISTEIAPQESTPSIIGSPYQQFDYQE